MNGRTTRNNENNAKAFYIDMMQILNLSSFCSSKVLAPVATGEFRPSQRVRHPLELKTSDASSWGSFTKRRNLCRQQIRRSVVASASATGWWQQFPELWTSIHGQQELDNILTSSADVVLVGNRSIPPPPPSCRGGLPVPYYLSCADNAAKSSSLF